MKKEQQALSALLATFPSPEAMTLFSEDATNKNAMESFLAFALKNGLIKTKDEKSLQDLIRQHAGPSRELTLPNLSFEELLEKKEEVLKMKLSGRALTDRINSLISEHRIELPKVSNSMLSRLKKEPANTPYKQKVLRSFSFWLGYERGELGLQWNFETLVKLCGDSKPLKQYKEGARIGFALYSRGDVVDQDIVDWLKTAVKNYIEQSAPHFLYGRWGKVRSHDMTTLHVDLPKEDEAEDPASYHQCLRSAVSLAHQIAIRWALSKHYSKNRFLSIGIAAGDYGNLDSYLLPTLNATLPGDPVIRVTDYVRQCLLINDIRVVLCRRPFETSLFNGETLTLWWVIALWSTLYFDFVPDLLEDRILKNDPASVEALTRVLWPPPDDLPRSAETNGLNAVTIFLKFPHNSLLGVEIAKTLFFRRRFWEALEMLRIVLSIDPTHLVARTLRMVLFHNLAIEAPTTAAAEALFERAEYEARFIEKNCVSLSEDFYCDYGTCHQGRAMLMLRHMRQGNGSFSDLQNAEQSRKAVFQALHKAENLFQQGMTVSPSSVRSAYLLCAVRVIKSILKSDKDIFSNPEKPIDAKPEIVRQTAMDFYLQRGFLRHEFPPLQQHEFLIQSVYSKTKIHDDSISSQAYRATSYFGAAVTMWDFIPFSRTVAIAKRTIQLLNDAKDITHSMEIHDLCIYSICRTFIEIINAKTFREYIDNAIKMIEVYIDKDLLHIDDHALIKSEETPCPMLLTLNF